MKHGRHWPREEQNANAYEGFGNLFGDEASADRVRAAWASLSRRSTTDPTLSGRNTTT
jgi:hypothetical protein